MNVPDHCETKGHLDEPSVKGEGRTFLLLWGEGTRLEISKGATVELLRSVIETGYLDSLEYIHVLSGATTLTGLPENITRLSRLTQLRIESSGFSNWGSVYPLSGLTELLILSKAEGALPEGIASLNGLEKLEIKAKKITALPGDLHALHGLRHAVVPKALEAELSAHVTHMPHLLFRRANFPRPDWMELGAGWSTEGLDNLIGSGLIDEIESLTLHAKSELTQLPENLGQLTRLKCFENKSAAFEGWNGLYPLLPQLKTLVLSGKAAGEMPDGISKLSSLESVQFKSKGITRLPADLPELPLLTISGLTVHGGLKDQLPHIEAEFDAHALTRILGRFESWLAQHTPDYLEKLAPGLSDDEISEVEGEYGVSLPAAARALYRWRNGDPSEDGRFVFTRIFMTLEAAAKTWKMLSEMNRAEEWAVDGVQPPSTWSESWWPLFRWPNGFHLCIDLTGTYKGRRGQIIAVWMKDSDRNILAPNLPSWLEGFVWGLEEGQMEKGAAGDIGWIGHRPPVGFVQRVTRGYPKKKKRNHAP